MHTIKMCAADGSNVQLLPIHNLGTIRSGISGRGKEGGHIDCRHFCINVLDWWSVAPYAMMCFWSAKVSVMPCHQISHHRITDDHSRTND